VARSASSFAVFLSCAFAAAACGVELGAGIPNTADGDPTEPPSEEDPNAPSGQGTAKLDGGKKPAPPSSPDPSPPPPASCDKTKPFGAPKKVPDLSQGGIADDVVRLYLGETRAVLSRDMGSSYDLYEATASGAGGFGSAGLITALSEIGSDDSFASISENGLFTVFATRRFGGPGGWDIFASSRTSLTTPWAKPVPVPNANSWSQDWYPYLAPAGDRLYFSSDRNGVFAIYEAQISFAQSGITATNATEMKALNSEGTQVQHPVVSADGLRIYFSRGTLSTRDVWTASRTKTSDAFSGAAKVAELSTNSDEYPTWISVDGCRIFLSGYYASTSRDIFMAEKPK
jgi:hypothetical protein